jgi:serine/threonine-protein phosphatase PGAM5
VAGRFLYLMRHGEAAPDGSLSARGEQQARRAGERLGGVPLATIHHSPQRRAVRTAEIVAGYVPGASAASSRLLDDCIPADPDPAGLPPGYARLVAGYSAGERAAGARQARQAIERFAGPGSTDPSGTGPTGDDEHELVITHNFLIGWFVRDALGAADWRWLGLNQQNCALTVLLYRPEMPPSLVSFNDASHLPAALRWTGFPESLRPATG